MRSQETVSVDEILQLLLISPYDEKNCTIFGFFQINYETAELPSMHIMQNNEGRNLLV